MDSQSSNILPPLVQQSDIASGFTRSRPNVHYSAIKTDLNNSFTQKPNPNSLQHYSVAAARLSSVEGHRNFQEPSKKRNTSVSMIENNDSSFEDGRGPNSKSFLGRDYYKRDEFSKHIIQLHKEESVLLGKSFSLSLSGLYLSFRRPEIKRSSETRSAEDKCPKKEVA